MAECHAMQATGKAMRCYQSRPPLCVQVRHMDDVLASLDDFL